MHETPGSQFFRITTGIQSGPHSLDKSRLVMTFLTNCGDAEVLYIFRLVLEGKAGKEILILSR